MRWFSGEERFRFQLLPVGNSLLVKSRTVIGGRVLYLHQLEVCMTLQKRDFRALDQPICLLLRVVVPTDAASGFNSLSASCVPTLQHLS